MGSSVMRWLLSLVVVVSVLLGASNAVAAVHFKRIEYNPPGRDRTHLDDEVVVIKNTGDSAVRMRNWELDDRAGYDFTFPYFHLRAGEVVRVHSGSSYGDGPRDVYWHSPFPLWNNHGDTAFLFDDHGNGVDRCSYRGGDEVAIC